MIDPIYEAYQGAVQEAYGTDTEEYSFLSDVVSALEDYKKSQNRKTLKALEDAIEKTGEPSLNLKFKDKTEGSLELLGDRFFGPPPVYNSKWDAQLDAVLKALKKEV